MEDHVPHKLTLAAVKWKRSGSSSWGLEALSSALTGLCVNCRVSSSSATRELSLLWSCKATHCTCNKIRSLTSFSDPQLRHQNKVDYHARSICFPAVRLSLDKTSHYDSRPNELTNWTGALFYKLQLGLFLFIQPRTTKMEQRKEEVTRRPLYGKYLFESLSPALLT
jgi:hypothetical protein